MFSEESLEINLRQEVLILDDRPRGLLGTNLKIVTQVKAWLNYLRVNLIRKEGTGAQARNGPIEPIKDILPKENMKPPIEPAEPGAAANIGEDVIGGIDDKALKVTYFE